MNYYYLNVILKHVLQKSKLENYLRMATANSIACSLLQNESDDEESFVVLGHSLPPESSLSVDCGCETSESLNSTVVQESLKLTSNALSQLPVSTSSFPSLPKVDHHDLVN